MLPVLGLHMQETFRPQLRSTLVSNRSYRRSEVRKRTSKDTHKKEILQAT